MIKSNDAVVGENYRRELFYDPQEQYIATNYSRSDTPATRSYTRSKEVVGFLLAHEAYPQERKKNYIEEPLKPLNNVKSKEVLKAIPKLKPPPNPCVHALLKKNLKPRKKFQT